MTVIKSYLVNVDQAAEEIFAFSARNFREVSKTPGFPKPIALGPRSVRYVRAELEDYVASLPRFQQPEPPQLSAARAAKAAGKPVLPEPFGQHRGSGAAR